MSKDTINLLKECNAGCKAATNSLEQVEPYLKEGKLRDMILYYDKEHIRLGEECHKLLNECKEEEKDPSLMAKAMSWISTEVKLLMDDEESKIASIMVKGCDMGIESLSRYLNEFKEANSQSVSIAKKLINLEQKFHDELLAYL